MNSDLLAIIANAPLLLAAIAGLAMAAWIPRRSRVLALLGLTLILVHAVLSLLEPLFLWRYVYGSLPPFVSSLLSWLFFVLLVAGILVLALAATAVPKRGSTAVHRYSPHPPAPHQSAPPPAPESRGPHPTPGA